MESKVFIETTIKRFGIKAKGRKIVGSQKSYKFRELSVPYGAILPMKMAL
ncbi:MAG: hypothetical protein U9R17_02210 [Thermodesulfobacteriota bacterium]|nr:hypothetical protein [Thermodesulfobacteriota bacterium]